MLNSPASQYGEMNIFFLGLISIQRQIDRDLFRYKLESNTHGTPITIECRGDPDYGIPHGIDNDFYSAIIHLYVEQGSPEDGVVRTTAYELLKISNRDHNKQNYQMLKNSLNRLYLSDFYLASAWMNKAAMRWETVTFKHIDKLRFTSDESTQLSNRSIILITLPQEIVSSVRSGYLLQFNEEILRDLRESSTRGLYRLLEARRRDPLDPSKTVDEFTENLMQWGQTCKILYDRADKVRRTLEPAHQELTEKGYIKNVEYVGRGQTQSVTYTFHPTPQKIPDSSKVDLLRSFGVFPKAAQRYAIDHEKWVEPVVRRYREMVAQNYQVDNPAGMIIKMLKDPESFGVTLEEPKALPAVAVQVNQKPVEVEPTITEEQTLATIRFLVQNLKGLPVRYQDACLHRLENEPGLVHELLKKITAAGADVQTRMALVREYSQLD